MQVATDHAGLWAVYLHVKKDRNDISDKLSSKTVGDLKYSR